MITLYKFHRDRTALSVSSSRQRASTDGLDAAIMAAGFAGTPMPSKHSEDPEPAGSWTIVQVDFSDDAQRSQFEEALPAYCEKSGIVWERCDD